MKIEVLELNERGVSVNDNNLGTPAETRYFDDNGGLPDGNFVKENIAGKWVLVPFKCTDDNLEFAYRTIDDSTLIKASSLLEDLKGKKLVAGASWYKENDPETLDWVLNSKYWGRGYDRKVDPEEAIIEIYFGEGGTRLYATVEKYFGEGGTRLYATVAGSKGESSPSQNQPPWCETSYSNETADMLFKYWLEIELS